MTYVYLLEGTSILLPSSATKSIFQHPQNICHRVLTTSKNVHDLPGRPVWVPTADASSHGRQRLLEALAAWASRRRLHAVRKVLTGLILDPSVFSVFRLNIEISKNIY